MPRNGYDGYGQDERKGGAAGAYGADSQGGSGYTQQDPYVKNPFSDPFYQGAMGSGSGGGMPVGGSSNYVSNAVAGTEAAVQGGGAGAAVVGPMTANELLRQVVSTRGIAGLIALLPMLRGLGGGGGNNPFGGDMGNDVAAELARGLALQRQRLEQAQPVYDDLIRRAEAYAPNASYGGPAYEYRSPTYGGR